MTTPTITTADDFNKEQLNSLFAQMNSACDNGFQEICDAINDAIRSFVTDTVGEGNDERIDAVADELWQLVGIPNITLEGAD